MRRFLKILLAIPVALLIFAGATWLWLWHTESGAQWAWDMAVEQLAGSGRPAKLEGRIEVERALEA